MGGGGRDDPPPTSSNDGGEFLLSLLQRPSHPHRHSQPPRPQPQAQAQPQRHHPHPAQSLTLDPAVAAVGPAVNFPGPSNGHDLSPPWPHTLSPPLAYPHAYFGVAPQVPSQGLSFDDLRRLALGGHDFRGIAPQSQSLPHQSKQQLHHQHQPQREHKFLFGSLPSEIRLSDSLSSNNLNFDSAREHKVAAGNRSHDRFEQNHQVNPRGYSYSDVNASRRDKDEFPEREMRALGLGKQNPSGNHGHALPGFSTKPRGRGDSGLGNRRTGFAHNVDQEKDNRSELDHKNAGLYGEGVRRFQFNDHRMPSKRSGEIRLSAQLDHPCPPSGSNLLSASASDVENVHFEVDEEESKGVEGEENKTRGTGGGDASEFEIEQFNDSLLTEGGLNEKNEKSQHRTHREKDFRSDSRGQRVLSQRMRNYRRSTECRWDIDTLNTAFIAIYDSLIPPEEEMAKQKQLLALLEKLVNKEWPEAQLYLYGSCANSFGVCKSDIDVCLAIQDPEIDKSEVLLKLADILQSGNLQNVQALTRARVPIVKLMDPATGISCDICINNVLAVVNTKLLRDYAQIDVRLRQLAFIVKHWAKSRGVNETYQGTLSSYAYVLMCIHFLQQRRPAVLPCLQEMGATYSVTVDDIKCSYFDQVEKLRDFGSRNKETIAQLVWAFFNYWAYCHDYTSSVISVRTGSLLSKQSKDWTRRIGNDRHLICIEDPFDTSHDLGRVVDKFSIKVLREEFERAAEIMQYDRNPCETLFEPYVAS